MRDAWRPTQYEQFKDERARPFFDLLSLVHPVPGGRVVDLGCGTGELTRVLHEHTQAAATVGVDNSTAMLERAQTVSAQGLTFVAGDLSTYANGTFDLIFSNAALHWSPDHPALLARLFGMLSPGGQLAIQVPANEDHASHASAREVAAQSPWRERLAGWARVSPILAPQAYAEVLHRLGSVEQHVRLQVYGHVLPSREGVVEWVKGTTLTDYERRLPPEQFPEFLAAYRERLFSQVPDDTPYFFTFKRILFWGRRDGLPPR
jgi:trans-aconitate 2-methyltransferase